MKNLTYPQRTVLRALVSGKGFIPHSCTNPTLSALERRGLADYDYMAMRWYPTDLGKSTVDENHADKAG